MTDRKTVGGKAAALGELVHANVRVPDAFVIPASCSLEFFREGELDSVLREALLALQDPSQVRETANFIAKAIRSTEIPPAIAQELYTSFDALHVDRVAVRSSAQNEDGIYAAWAGQLDTFLNTDRAHLLESVRACWMSLFSERALTYRLAQHVKDDHLCVAVIVQSMIQSEVSGIAFSVHPVTRSNDTVIIEAAFGLGEAIVGGKITPDSYEVQKSNLQISSRTIQFQSKQLALVGNSTVWKDVDPLQSRGQKLSDAIIIRLTKEIIALEKTFGLPLDVEWAVENHKLYILQCRPITTLTDSDHGYH